MIIYGRTELYIVPTTGYYHAKLPACQCQQCPLFSPLFSLPDTHFWAGPTPALSLIFPRNAVSMMCIGVWWCHPPLVYALYKAERTPSSIQLLLLKLVRNHCIAIRDIFPPLELYTPFLSTIHLCPSHAPNLSCPTKKISVPKTQTTSPPQAMTTMIQATSAP